MMRKPPLYFFWPEMNILSIAECLYQALATSLRGPRICTSNYKHIHSIVQHEKISVRTQPLKTVYTTLHEIHPPRSIFEWQRLHHMETFK